MLKYELLLRTIRATCYLQLLHGTSSDIFTLLQCWEPFPLTVPVTGQPFRIFSACTVSDGAIAYRKVEGVHAHSEQPGRRLHTPGSFRHDRSSSQAFHGGRGLRPLEPGQYLSVRYTERLSESGIEPSVGSRGDSYDCALAESVIGLYKDRGHSKGRPVEGSRRCRIRHSRLGVLVQRAAAPGTDWRHTTDRIRTDVLSAATVPPRRGRTQLKLSPKTRRRF